MDAKRRVIREIEPLNEDELETDLRFLFHNRTDTVDQFVEEAIPVIKYHINLAMERYQGAMLDNLTNSLQGEIAGIILRTRRETIYAEGRRGEPAIEPKTTGGKNEVSPW